MTLLSNLTAMEVTSPGDASILRDVLSAIGSVDGSVDQVERAVVQALFRTVPQLREEAPPAGVPPRANRRQILDELGQLTNERLRRQCFVLAVELAISSDGVNRAEDDYLTALQTALRIDDSFAEMTVQVLAAKYARSPE